MDKRILLSAIAAPLVALSLLPAYAAAQQAPAAQKLQAHQQTQHTPSDRGESRTPG